MKTNTTWHSGLVRTIDVGFTAFARMKQADLVVNDIRPGDVVVGLASYGQAIYEETYNGGTGSNGLTSARHDVLHKIYAERFPESYDPRTPLDFIYTGSKRLTDKINIGGKILDVGQLMLSPTRTYLPVLKEVLSQLRPHLHGLIHCTGGGQTKVLKFIEHARVVKNNLLPIPPLFQMIHDESGTSWKEMYQVFNMGHRLEIYLPEAHAQQAISIAAAFGIEAAVVGYVEAHPSSAVRIESPHGTFEYQ